MTSVSVSDDVDYPVRVLEGCTSALVLFAAAFGGRQDAAHIRDAGLTATCVDTDPVALAGMERDYPADWTFVVGDALDDQRYDDGSFDLVSVDPFTGTAMDRSAERIAEWCRIARRAVVLGICAT